MKKVLLISALLVAATANSALATWGNKGTTQKVEWDDIEQDQDQHQGQGQEQGQQQGQGQQQSSESKSTGVGVGIGAADADSRSKSKANSDSNSESSARITDKSTDVNKNSNIGIQGQTTDFESEVDTDIDTTDVNKNANIGVQDTSVKSHNTQGDQTQRTNASSDNINGNSNLNRLDSSNTAETGSQATTTTVDASDRSTNHVDAREFTRNPVKIKPAAPSRGTTIKTQAVFCDPNGNFVIIDEETTVPEHRTGFGFDLGVGFANFGSLSYYNAGRLHKSQMPAANAAVRGVYEQRIQRLSQHGSNPLAQSMIANNMQDRASVGNRGRDLEAAREQAQVEWAAYVAYVQAGGNPDIMSCAK